MFREMRRKKQALPPEECIRVLMQEKRGVLSVLGEDGYPYGIPMNFWYNPENGHICFHGSKQGHKLDALRRCNKVSFCVYDAGYRKEGEWALNVSSVILFGRIRPMEDPAAVTAFLQQFGRKYTDDTAYIEHEITVSTPNVLCLELLPEHMTGKLVNES